jgi:hypothetical protein
VELVPTPFKVLWLEHAPEATLVQLLMNEGMDAIVMVPPEMLSVTANDLLNPVLELIPVNVIDATLTETAPTFRAKIVILP